jgi:PAS domain-containing protein
MKRKSYVMVVIFIGLMLLSFVLLFVGGIIYRWHSSKTRRIFEKQFMEITRNVILSSQPKIPTDISDEFALELSRTQQYAQKRMNFSTLFQAALPFPALLLNSNLKVVWANSSLCDLFHIALDECEKDSLSWDFLIRYTNLIEQDPVLEALMGNFSGIFQIRIKTSDEHNGVPFEMYVCPINSGVSANIGNQKHVMLYFYPLSSMNETIQNQVKYLLNPIKKSLNALTDHTFDQKFRNQIRKDFVNAGIEDVFKGLEHLYDFTTREKNGLIEDITKLEANLSDNYKLLSDIEMQNNAFKKLQMELLDNLKLLREHLINYVDVSNSQHNSSDEMVSLYKNSLLNADDMFRIATSNLEKIEETQEIISSLEKAKGSLRPIRENLQLLNNRIVQGLDKALTFERNFSGSSPELKQLSTNFVRLKTDIDLIDQQMKDFSNIIKYIDLKLSKASMILQNDEESMQLLRNYEKEGQAFEKKLEEGFYEKSKMIQEGQELEDKIVQSVEDFFVTFKKNLTHFTAINSLMKIYLQRDEEVEGTVLGSIKQIESQVKSHSTSNPIQ